MLWTELSGFAAEWYDVAVTFDRGQPVEKVVL